MRRTALLAKPNGAVDAIERPHVIHPTAVYLVDDAQRLLKLRKSTIRREVREKRLTISKRGGRYYLLGRWLLEWIEAGIVRHGGT